MAEYEPTPEAVEAFKRAWHEADAEGDEGNRVSRGLAAALAQRDVELRAEVGVCEHQNANYLRMMSERDALRAEVERLREDYQAACEARMMFHDELDEAQRQVADLRAGIERIRDALTAHIVGHGPMIDAESPESDLTRLLAGSGEQPGERDATPDEAHDIGYSKGHADGYREAMAEHRPAPMVPDSTDVRYLADRIETAMTDDGHRMPRTDETRYLAHVAAQTALAVVGQGVTAEQARAEAERRFQDRDAGAERSLHHWFIEGALWASAAARPSEKEGS